MRNANANQLKKSIFMEYESFKELVNKLCGDESCVDLGEDGIEFHGPNGDSNTVIEALNEYFNITVTSIHADDCYEYPGVWIIYKENKEPEIVKVEFYDPDWAENVKHRPGVVEAYYVEDPDEEKLTKLKAMVETRYDSLENDDLTEEEREKAEKFVDDIWANIDKFIHKNFKVVRVDRNFVINY